MDNVKSEPNTQPHLLLSVSNALATVRTRDDLFGVMAGELTALLRYEDSDLIIFAKNDLFSWSLLPILNTSRQQHRYYNQLFNRLIPIPEHCRAFCRDPTAQVRVVLEADLIALGDCELASFVLETGIRAAIVFKLVLAGHIIGMWTIYYTSDAQVDQALLPLVEGIAHQLTVAVANVLANEAGAAREREESIYIAVGQALLTSADWPTMTTALARELHQCQPFDVLGILLDATPSGSERAYDISLQDDKSWLCRDSLPGQPGWEADPNQCAKLAADRRAAFHEPAVWVGDGFEQHCQENKFGGFVQQVYGLRSLLYLPVPLKHQGIAWLFFGSRTGYSLTETDLDRLIWLRPQIALGLENHLAFDELNRVKALSKQSTMAMGREIDRVKAILNESPLLTALLQQLVPQTPAVCPESASTVTLRDMERSTIIDTLRLTNGRIRGEGGTAQLLAIEPNTLDARMHKLGIIKSNYAAKCKRPA